jgi:hypothetical protein
MKRRFLAAALAIVALLGLAACADGPVPTSIGMNAPSTTSTGSADPSATPSASAATPTPPSARPPVAGSDTGPANPPRTTPPPGATTATTNISTTPTPPPPPGLTPADQEACDSARYSNALLLTMIQPLLVFYDPEATEGELTNARMQIVNTFEQGTSALNGARDIATTPALKAALGDAAGAFATATGVALSGSVEQILALFDEGNAIDAALIEVLAICNA